MIQLSHPLVGQARLSSRRPDKRMEPTLAEASLLAPAVSGSSPAPLGRSLALQLYPEAPVDVFVSKPDIALQDAFLQMLNDYDAHDPEYGGRYAAARSDFGAYVQSLHEDERGFIGVVPYSHRWVVSIEGTIVGVVRVRHHIYTDFLANELGHIGYDVPPSHRGRGFGVVTLKAGLDCARELGLERVLLYADTDNPASWHTIERCGGVLEAERYSQHYHCLVRRYWITLLQA